MGNDTVLGCIVPCEFVPVCLVLVPLRSSFFNMDKIMSTLPERLAHFYTIWYDQQAIEQHEDWGEQRQANKVTLTMQVKQQLNIYNLKLLPSSCLDHIFEVGIDFVIVGLWSGGSP